MLFARQPTRTERLVDAALGVSRRRRQAAMLAIAGGLSVLRPIFRRAALVVFVALVWTLVR